MRALPGVRLLASLMVLLLMVFSLVPAVVGAGDEDEMGRKFGDEDELAGISAVFAGDEDELAGDEDELVGDEDELTRPAAIHFQEGEGEENGSLAGTGIALGIVALILLLVAVVAVIGAASLGIIGLGYWQSESGD
jgi:hypothetical protein